MADVDGGKLRLPGTKGDIGSGQGGGQQVRATPPGPPPFFGIRIELHALLQVKKGGQDSRL